MIKVAVIGSGLSATTFHIPLFTSLPNFQLHTILARSESSQANVRKLFPQVRIVSSEDELYESKEVDLVIICTPNEYHFKQAKLAISHGKHVVVEKPFTVTVAEADELIELANESNLILSVYQNRRLDGDFLTYQSIAHRLGRVVEFESHYDRHVPQRSQGWKDQPGEGRGLLRDLGSHTLDQVLLLFGKPSAIFARILNLRNLPPDTEDYFNIVLSYSSHGKAECEVIVRSTKTSLGLANRFVVKGTKGTFLKDGTDPQEGQLKAGMSLNDPDYAVEPDNLWGTLITANGSEKIPTIRGRYVDFYKSVAEAIEHNDPTRLLVKAEEGRDCIWLIEEAYRSAKEGKQLELSRN